MTVSNVATQMATPSAVIEKLPSVEPVAHGETDGGPFAVLRTEDRLDRLGDADHEADRGHELREWRRVRSSRKMNRSRTSPRAIETTIDGDERGRHERPVMVVDQDVEHDGGRERLRAEGEVEDTRRLVRQHQPDRDRARRRSPSERRREAG